ncbi:hypothetical protein [Streptomyces specialis]|uniref:hypothetical protein n=1 Tax=Streptomyces specialis TaxID=498367 RepID=UPI00131D386D|nr:hypothetical protein [Streptomyces specialis]
MATRHDRDTQERRRRLRERQERERREMRRRQQEQTAALHEIDGAVERLDAARAAVAAAVARGVDVFGSADALAEVVPFDAKEIRAFERHHRRQRPVAEPKVPAPAPPPASGEGTAAG